MAVTYIGVTPKGYFDVGYDQNGTKANTQALYNTTTAAGRNALDDAFDTMLSWFSGSTLQYARPIPLILSNPPPMPHGVLHQTIPYW